MSLTIHTAPAVEPVSVAEAKLHCKIDSADEDAAVTLLIKAARRYCENYRRESFILTVWNLGLDRFPRLRDRRGGCLTTPYFDRDAILLPVGPAISVTGILYADTAGDGQVFGDYDVDLSSRPGRIRPEYGVSWPQTREQMNAVAVTFSAGYGAAGSNVPEHLREAMLLLIGHWYRNREAVNIGNITTELPLGARDLLNVDRMPLVG